MAAKRSTEERTERLGVAHRQGDDVQNLSLGNQQRVQLAAALVHNPSILVLDEPFSGLDPIAVDVMSNLLLTRPPTASRSLLLSAIGLWQLVAGKVLGIGFVGFVQMVVNRRWRHRRCAHADVRRRRHLGAAVRTGQHARGGALGHPGDAMRPA